MFGLVWNFQIPQIDGLALRYLEYKYAVHIEYSWVEERGNLQFTLSFQVGPDSHGKIELLTSVSRTSSKELNSRLFLINGDGELLAALAGRAKGRLDLDALPIPTIPTFESGVLSFRLRAEQASKVRNDLVRSWLSGTAQYKSATETMVFTLDRLIDTDGFPLTSDFTIRSKFGFYIRVSMTRLSKLRRDPK